MNRHRLAKLEQAAATRPAPLPVVPDCGPVDELGWPTAAAGWETLIDFAVVTTADNPDMLARLRTVYGAAP